jgi:hypothetical protein
MPKSFNLARSLRQRAHLINPIFGLIPSAYISIMGLLLSHFLRRMRVYEIYEFFSSPANDAPFHIFFSTLSYSLTHLVISGRSYDFFCSPLQYASMDIKSEKKFFYCTSLCRRCCRCHQAVITERLMFYLCSTSLIHYHSPHTFLLFWFVRCNNL